MSYFKTLLIIYLSLSLAFGQAVGPKISLIKDQRNLLESVQNGIKYQAKPYYWKDIKKRATQVADRLEKAGDTAQSQQIWNRIIVPINNILTVAEKLKDCKQHESLAMSPVVLQEIGKECEAELEEDFADLSLLSNDLSQYLKGMEDDFVPSPEQTKELRDQIVGQTNRMLLRNYIAVKTLYKEPLKKDHLAEINHIIDGIQKIPSVSKNVHPRKKANQRRAVSRAKKKRQNLRDAILADKGFKEFFDQLKKNSNPDPKAIAKNKSDLFQYTRESFQNISTLNSAIRQDENRISSITHHLGSWMKNSEKQKEFVDNLKPKFIGLRFNSYDPEHKNAGFNHPAYSEFRLLPEPLQRHPIEMALNGPNLLGRGMPRQWFMPETQRDLVNRSILDHVAALMSFRYYGSSSEFKIMAVETEKDLLRFLTVLYEQYVPKAKAELLAAQLVQKLDGQYLGKNNTDYQYFKLFQDTFLQSLQKQVPNKVPDGKLLQYYQESTGSDLSALEAVMNVRFNGNQSEKTEQSTKKLLKSYFTSLSADIITPSVSDKVTDNLMNRFDYEMRRREKQDSGNYTLIDVQSSLAESFAKTKIRIDDQSALGDRPDRFIEVPILEIPKHRISLNRSMRGRVRQDLVQNNFLVWKDDDLQDMLYYKQDPANGLPPDLILDSKLDSALDNYFSAIKDVMVKMAEMHNNENPEEDIMRALQFNPGIIPFIIKDAPHLLPTLCYYSNQTEEYFKNKEYWDNVWSKTQMVLAIGAGLALLATTGPAGLAAVGGVGLLTTLAGGAAVSGIQTYRNFSHYNKLSQDAQMAHLYFLATGTGDKSISEELQKMADSEKRAGYWNGFWTVASTVGFLRAAKSSPFFSNYAKELAEEGPIRLILRSRDVNPNQKLFGLFRRMPTSQVKNMPMFQKWYLNTSKALLRNKFKTPYYHFTPGMAAEETFLNLLRLSGKSFTIPTAIGVGAVAYNYVRKPIIDPLREFTLGLIQENHEETEAEQIIGEILDDTDLSATEEQKDKALETFLNRQEYLEYDNQERLRNPTPQTKESYVEFHDYLTKKNQLPESLFPFYLKTAFLDNNDEQSWSDAPYFKKNFILPEQARAKSLTPALKYDLLTNNSLRLRALEVIDNSFHLQFLESEESDELRKGKIVGSLLESGLVDQSQFRRSLLNLYQQDYIDKTELKNYLVRDVENQTKFDMLWLLNNQSEEGIYIVDPTDKEILLTLRDLRNLEARKLRAMIIKRSE